MTLPYVARSGGVDRYSWLCVPSHEAMNNNARTTKQLCNAYYTGYGGQYAKSPIMLIFTVYYGDVIGSFSMP